MGDPYLYEDADVLRNLAGIKDFETLRKAEADITNLAMIGIYNQSYDSFNTETLQDIHRTIFGHIYEWAGDFRTIQMTKSEDILGGDTVRYTYPKEIKKQLAASMKELAKLKRSGTNDRDIVFRMVRITAHIWQTHPFREGNTRSVIVFAVLFAKYLGFEVEHELFKNHASYVRSAMVWASQGIYSKYEYLEQIFYDAILHDDGTQDEISGSGSKKYDQIETYKVKEYKERPHEYSDENKV
ncbi:MAG: Fic/DOC family protein [Eubacteriales bacterium]